MSALLEGDVGENAEGWEAESVIVLRYSITGGAGEEEGEGAEGAIELRYSITVEGVRKGRGCRTLSLKGKGTRGVGVEAQGSMESISP